MLLLLISISLYITQGNKILCQTQRDVVMLFFFSSLYYIQYTARSKSPKEERVGWGEVRVEVEVRWCPLSVQYSIRQSIRDLCRSTGSSVRSFFFTLIYDIKSKPILCEMKNDKSTLFNMFTLSVGTLSRRSTYRVLKCLKCWLMPLIPCPACQREKKGAIVYVPVESKNNDNTTAGRHVHVWACMSVRFADQKDRSVDHQSTGYHVH